MKVKETTLKLSDDFPFHINKTWMRKTEYRNDHYHWHDFFEITYILEGSGTAFINGQTFDLQKGDIIIFNKSEIHGWSIENDLQLFVVVFSSDLIFNNQNSFDYEYLKFFAEPGRHFKNKIGKDQLFAKKIYGVMLDIYNEWVHNDIGRQLMIKSYVLRMLTMLTRHYQNSGCSASQSNQYNNHIHRLQDALNYISENYDSKITLKETADKAYMSPAYFSSFFKKNMGCTYSEYLTGLRIHRAQVLIQTTSLNIVDIAAACGFNNMSNFYRAYKKITNTSVNDIQ